MRGVTVLTLHHQRPIQIVKRNCESPIAPVLERYAVSSLETEDGSSYKLRASSKESENRGSGGAEAGKRLVPHGIELQY